MGGMPRGGYRPGAGRPRLADTGGEARTVQVHFTITETEAGLFLSLATDDDGESTSARLNACARRCALLGAGINGAKGSSQLAPVNWADFEELASSRPEGAAEKGGAKPQPPARRGQRARKGVR